MHGRLARFAYLESCTLGWLTFGELSVATIERPWIANPLGRGGKLFASCVPDGTYRLIPHSGRFRNVYALVNEDIGVYYQHRPAGQPWGRTAILIHEANRASEVVGCIGVGLRHVGTQAVVDSRLALDKLRAVLGREEHMLTIEPRGTQEVA